MAFNKPVLICKRKLQVMNSFLFSSLFFLHKRLLFTDYRPYSQVLCLHVKHFMFFPRPLFTSSSPFYTYTLDQHTWQTTWVLTPSFLPCNCRSLLTCEYLSAPSIYNPPLLSCDSYLCNISGEDRLPYDHHMLLSMSYTYCMVFVQGI